MPPKTSKRGRETTPPVRKKPNKGSAQPPISAFFASPSKPRASSPISVGDSDDDVVPVSPVPVHKRVKGEASSGNGTRPSRERESDEAMARRLADEWERTDKGKGRASPVDVKDEEHDPTPLVTGINGSSSSARPLPASRAVHPMFAKPPPPPPPSQPTTPKKELQAKAEAKPSPTKITSTAAEPVEPIDFDTDPFLFRPTAVDVSKWPRGRLPYSVLVGVYVQVSSTRSRLLIVRVLTNFLHLVLAVSPLDLPPALYLLSNHLLPSYLPSELGIGSSIITKAIQDVSGARARDLHALWQKHGDPGDVAFDATRTRRTLVTPAPLVVADVYARLLGLIKLKGAQSGKLKGDVVRKLMVQARGEEVRFLVRTLVGNLRIGAVRLTLLTSLARAVALHCTPLERLSAIQPLPADKKKAPADAAREAVELELQDAVRLVRRVYVRHPNYADLVRGLADGLDGLEDRVPVSVGIPLSPMLGSITRSLDEVFTRLGELPFTAEAKLDGQRLQLHVRRDGPEGDDDGGRWVEADGERVWVRLFSRHLEDMTEKYPDVCALALALLCRPLPPPDARAPFAAAASAPSSTALALLRTGALSSLILDAEIVAVDKATGAHRTFQELTARAKKDVRVEDIKVVVAVCAFDCMLVNDTPLLGLPFSHRRHLLRTLLPPLQADDPWLARFAHVDSIDSTDCDDAKADVQAFFEKVVEAKCEGLMVKLLESGEGIAGDDDVEDDVGEDAPRTKQAKAGKPKKKPLPATYEPDQRSQGWLKVKKDYLEGLGDSLDLVPIGAWWGQGRKAGWWSPILLACYNPETGALEAVTKCMSGFSDAFYKDLLVRYPPEGQPDVCNPNEALAYIESGDRRPTVWFRPTEVWEIRGADITLSPVYPAAAAHIGGERGLSLRFPRFIRRRDDKSVEQATTSAQFADMYRRQMREVPAARVVKPRASSEARGEADGRADGDDEGDGEGEGEGDGEGGGDVDGELDAEADVEGAE
ncbi:hypothetical protein Q5752_005645 [Cryptotrichosporon argae]